MPPRRPTSSNAYTLVDLIVVLAISAAIAAIGLPRYAGAVSNFRAQQAAARVAADLALARWVARSTSAASGAAVTFDLAGGTYTVPGTPGTTGPATAYTVALSAEPYRARLASVSFNGATRVTFDRYGQPSSGGTVVVAVGAVQMTVTLDPDSGTATIQ